MVFIYVYFSGICGEEKMILLLLINDILRCINLRITGTIKCIDVFVSPPDRVHDSRICLETGKGKWGTIAC